MKIKEALYFLLAVIVLPVAAGLACPSTPAVAQTSTAPNQKAKTVYSFGLAKWVERFDDENVRCYIVRGGSDAHPISCVVVR